MESPVPLPPFSEFKVLECRDDRVITLSQADRLFSDCKDRLVLHHKELNVAVLEDGWQFSLPKLPEVALRLSRDCRRIISNPWEKPWHIPAMQPLLRTALECASARAGVISLHAACVEKDGAAVCFCGPSGVGKSTRAAQWVETLGAKLISGDRPSVRLDGERVLACGIPWDGKEGIHRNVQLPLKMICAIVRDDAVSARRLTRSQARQFLMQQAFIPMWDTEAAVAVMAVLRRIYDRIPVIELRCGPDAASAGAAYELIYHQTGKILEETEP